jgi:insulysin
MSPRLRLLALAALVLPAVFATAASAPLPELPPRLKSPTDQAQFRRFTLDNGLKVLLVSDPKFNKSGAALACAVGQIDDPADREGMAHFLEHMLFLGTKKYPESNDYGNFMQSNGGYNNAYTASDHTNYQFEVRHEALAEGARPLRPVLHRPALQPGIHRPRDQRRAQRGHAPRAERPAPPLQRLCASSTRPAAARANSPTGNKDTLAGATPAQVRAFYESTYTADRMALAIAGKAPLDELEKHARTLFAPIPRRDVATVPCATPPSSRARPPSASSASNPIKEVRSLNLEFVIPATRPDFLSKPDELLSQLISYPARAAWSTAQARRPGQLPLRRRLGTHRRLRLVLHLGRPHPGRLEKQAQVLTR